MNIHESPIDFVLFFFLYFFSRNFVQTNAFQMFDSIDWKWPTYCYIRNWWKMTDISFSHTRTNSSPNMSAPALVLVEYASHTSRARKNWVKRKLYLFIGKSTRSSVLNCCPLLPLTYLLTHFRWRHEKWLTFHRRRPSSMIWYALRKKVNEPRFAHMLSNRNPAFNSFTK